MKFQKTGVWYLSSMLEYEEYDIKMKLELRLKKLLNYLYLV